MIKRSHLIAIILMIIGIIIIAASMPTSMYVLLTSGLPPDAFPTLMTMMVIFGVLFIVGGIYLIGGTYGIWKKVLVRTNRPVTAVVLGICFGIAFWSIPFFVVANYRLLPEFWMNLLMGLIVFFSVWGSVISVSFFIVGFILGFFLLYSTSSSASF